MEFSQLCEVFEAIQKTTKRLEKTAIIARFLATVPKEERPDVFLLLQGNVFLPWESQRLGFAVQMALKAIALATGYPQKEVEKTWKQTGDLGKTAAALIAKKQQATLFHQSLSLQHVVKTLRKLPLLSGEKSTHYKIQQVAHLLTSATPLEAQYLLRFVLEDMRIGIGEGTIRDALCWVVFGKKLGINYAEGNYEPEDRETYNLYLTLLQEAYDLTLDFAQVMTVAEEKGQEGLQALPLPLGRPMKVMLYQKAEGIADAFVRVGKPCAFEHKYDGFRMLIHHYHDQGKRIIKIFTRRLEEVSHQFPDVVKLLQKILTHDVVLDAEAVGYDPDNKHYLPFQQISQRIQRKYKIHELAEKLPVELNVFDILYYDGTVLLKKPFKERRALLEQIVPVLPWQIKPSTLIITANEQEATAFYQKAIAQGFEGVMAKNLEGIYKPGSRVGYGVKIKPIMEPLEVVITQAEWGEGKRGQWLSSYTIAVLDENGNLQEIGKVSSGLKEVGEGDSYETLTKLLLARKKAEKGKTVLVEPLIVLEVAYEEIQKSPSYASGYALRFPRILRVRYDKNPDDIATIAQVEELYLVQKKSSLQNNNI